MGNNMGAAVLVIVGVVLVFLSLFAGSGNVPIILIGVVSLIAAGTLQAIGMRRG